MAVRRRSSGGRKRRRVNLKKTLFLLPNLITLSSVFCGFYSMVVSSEATSTHDFYRAAILILFAAVFDTLDGRVARMTKTQSAFGLQLDSLADVVSFGAAPALLLYHWSLAALGTVGVFACFAFVAGGAVRLARFNVLSMGSSGAPTKPSKYIVGLPIPAAAAVLVSLVAACTASDGVFGIRSAAQPLMAMVLVLAGLMVSSVKFRSFKNVTLNAGTLAFIAFIAGSSALVMARLSPIFVVAWLVSFYVLVGILEWLWHIPGRLRGKDAAAVGDATDE